MEKRDEFLADVEKFWAQEKHFLLNMEKFWFYKMLIVDKRFSRSPGGIPENGLDLGSGPEPRNHFRCRNIIGLDILDGDNVVRHDLFKGSLPFRDSSFDVITAFDVLEHIPRAAFGQAYPRFPFVSLMSEISRCLKVGGIFYSRTPIFPHHQAYCDPTHVNIMTDQTLKQYFSGDTPGAASYGYNGRLREILSKTERCYLLSFLKKF